MPNLVNFFPFYPYESSSSPLSPDFIFRPELFLHSPIHPISPFSSSTTAPASARLGPRILFLGLHGNFPSSCIFPPQTNPSLHQNAGTPLTGVSEQGSWTLLPQFPPRPYLDPSDQPLTRSTRNRGPRPS
ncbi:hypothetical protein CBS147332_5547 [Penicillium roqueforti]|nr:hypothetical protein LCP963914a_9217 [Penicillium roqueforti]KAI2698983.1 hypothetical protein CBS147372_6830 [Penicillium roqueforti]KAI2708278.1 hypothetical protein CBS147318_9588 [Penicillium roqueforti]KAI2711911.1 hypothetical protein CBS147332_5547 [Penicillium roqueforti]KAI3107894.1 hypothetical protein CBS147331_5995 [Penicillium roqueforti]